MDVYNRIYYFIEPFQNLLNIKEIKSDRNSLALNIIFSLAVAGITFYMLKNLYSFSVAPRASSTLRASSANLLDSKGHFTSDKYAGQQKAAIEYVDKILKKIVNPNPISGWEWAYISQKEEILKKMSSVEITATCFGNVCALGNEIIRRGKILPAGELQKIEASENFAKKAIGFQFSQFGICEEISKRIGSEKPSALSENDKMILKERAQLFRFQRQVNCLQTYELTYQDIAELSKEEFEVINYLIERNISFKFARDKIFKGENLQKGKEFIQWIVKKGFPSVLPMPNQGKTVQSYFNLSNYPQIIFPKNCKITTKESFFLSNSQVDKNDLSEKFQGLSGVSGI